MVEYHVDTQETEYGGRRSVRYKEGKMLFIWGHDEAIFKQFLLTKKNWVGPNGETAIVPKDDGIGPAFQNREFGFGLELNKQQLAQVNAYRRNKKYQDEQAAKAK
jgi:hypothetical protein